MKKSLIVTGGAGFIGSNFLHLLTTKNDFLNKYDIHVVDSLTYAGKFARIEKLFFPNASFIFHQIDIRNKNDIFRLFDKICPVGVLNFAAETHVDNSISAPMVFIETNVLGTANLLNASLQKFKLDPNFLYLQVSTDEVYGSLSDSDPAFTETTPLAPNSPYSASKASADLLCRSYFETYGLPVIITRCTNNYGPNQHHEKLIPLMISRAKKGESLPVYGTGKNVRDWIHVDDHNEGIFRAFLNGKPGQIYNFGGGAEFTNIQIVEKIIELTKANKNQIQFVTDRLGHDWRYAIDFTKAKNELGWKPQKHILENLSELIPLY